MIFRVPTILFVLAAGFALAQPTRPTVVTSIQPYYDLVRQIAGDGAEVVRLLPPGASPHTFDPTPRDVAGVAGANLVVLNGGLDAWLLGMVEASGTGAAVLEAVTEVSFEPVEGVEHEDAHGDEAEGEHEGAHTDEAGAHDHAGTNPHIWLDPLLMAEFVPVVAERLAELDPENAGAYQDRGAALVADLTALDGELSGILADVRGAPFVPFHDAWPYFARRYGLNLVVEIEPAPGREPSARYLAEALGLIRESGAKAVFGERQLPARPAEVVAENAGVALFVLDPLGDDTQSYQDLMRHNARTVAEALE